MNVTISKTLAKNLGLEEAIVYQFLVGHMDENKEVNMSYIQLTKRIDLFNINVVKKSISNLVDADLISKTYYANDFEDMTMTIKVLNVIK